MSTILKDSEVSAVVPDALSARPAAASAPSEGPGKPQPVALEVSVTVNGARTVEGSDKREPFSESTKTVLVFSNGAVIRLQSSVAAGQLLFLTNEKTKKEVVCQVVKSKNYRNVSGYVELEFTEPVIGFWGMRFPGDRIAPASPAAPAVPTPANSSPATGAPVAPVAALPAAPVSSPNKSSATPQPSVAAPAVVTPISAPKSVTPAPPSDAREPKSPTISNAPISQSLAGKPITESVPPPSASSTVTPITPFVAKFDSTTTSSSALSSASVITLPRAAQSKPPAPKQVPAQSISESAPTPEIPAAAVENTATKISAENSADALRAENARLQEQLSAFLFADGKKAADKPAEKIASAPIAENKSTETANKIFDLAQLAAELDAPPKAKVAEPAIAPFVPAPSVLPPSPVLAKPATPAKLPVAPFKSILDDQEVKVPSWLEPLARNAAISAPPEEDSASSEIAAVESANLLQEEFVPVASDAHSEELSSLPAPNFGSRLLLGEQENSASSSSGSKKTFLFGAVAAGILLAAVGGYWYTHQAPATSGAAVAAPAIQQPADTTVTVTASQTTPPTAGRTPGASPNARPVGAIVDQAATPPPQNANLAVKDPRSVASAISAASNSVQSAVPATAQPAAAQIKRTLGDVHLAAPTVNRNGNSEALGEAEPAIGANNSSTEGAASLGANFAANSGPVAPAIPIPVGGVVKTAQLLKSVPPTYPAFARTQRVTGDVKIDALVDTSGHITTMKVVSGPTMLHQAAMDALRQWKYQPATLNGNSVPSHLTVVIQFRM
jgi:TonB family protein